MLGQVQHSFLSGREIVLAGLGDPEMVRLEVGGDHHLRDGNPLFAAQVSDHLARQEVGVDDQVPGFCLHQWQEAREADFLERCPEPVPPAWGGRAARPVHEVIDEAEHRWRLIDAIPVSSRVTTAHGRGGDRQDVHVPYVNRRSQALERQLQRFRGPQVPHANTGG